MIDPSNNADAWNRLIVNGVASPGTVRLSGHKKEIGWDIKDASGQDGGTTTRKGEPVKQFSATFTLLDDPFVGSDFADWDAFQAMLELSVVTDPPTALDIVHPDLQRNGVGAASVKSIGEMALDGLGGATIVVEFLEYRPAKKKPPGSSQSPKATGDSDPRVDAAEKELDDVIEDGASL